MAMQSPEISRLSENPAAQEFRIPSDINRFDACTFINDAFARLVRQKIAVSSLRYMDHALANATVDDEGESSIRKIARLSATLPVPKAWVHLFSSRRQRGGWIA